MAITPKSKSRASKLPADDRAEASDSPAPPIRHIFRIDLRSLAAFRIALALVMLWDLALRSRDLTAHYTDAGVLPRKILGDFFLSMRPYFSLHVLHGSAQFEALLFGIAALCGIALLAGYRTWIATAACWFLTCSLHARNPFILHGGDDLIRMLLFWGMFVPLGGRWSVDRARSSRVDTEDDGVCSWGTAGLLLQLCFVYLFSSAMKSHPSWRHDGTAVYLALSIDQFTTPIGRILLPFHALLKVLTFGTLALEMAGSFLALFSYESARLRTLVVAVFILFHIGLGLCIELGIFPAVCIAGWLAFLPGSAWDALDRYALPRIRRLKALQPATKTVTAMLAQIRVRPLKLRLSFAGNIIAGLALFYIVLWNVRAGNFKRFAALFPMQLNVIGEAARIDQYWNLFAPYPSLDHGWYVLDAHLRDGEEVDLRTGKPVTWEKPDLVSATYTNERWRKYLMNLQIDEYTRYRPYYADYLMRTWNASHPAQQHIARLEITFVLETALPNYQLTPRKHVRLWAQNW